MPKTPPPEAPDDTLSDIMASRARLAMIDTQILDHQRQLEDLGLARILEAQRLTSLTTSLKKAFAHDDLFAFLAAPGAA